MMLQRLLKPSFTDFIFVILLGWMFALQPTGFASLLSDGDTGWHIRTGQWILEHGEVPKTDLFSFSKPGETWFAWEWGMDVVFALLYGVAGLKAVTLFSAVLVSLFAAMLARAGTMRGAVAGPAVGVALIAVSASSVHFLARPHLATLVLVPAFAWVLDRDREKQDRLLWVLVPATMVWTNLHGGFLAGLSLLGLYALGAAMEALWWKASWAPVRRLTLVTVLATLATLANPYGYQLHLHAAEFLQAGFIQNSVMEFQSPDFRGETARLFEVLLILGLLASATQIRARRLGPALVMIFWAHQALTSVRHITVFCSVAAPWVAVELSVLWRAVAARAGRKSTFGILDQLSTDLLAQFRHTSLWPAAAVAALLFLPLGFVTWPADFPGVKFPTAMVAKHGARLRGAKFVLTEDQWADYLIYRYYPKQRVYFDGRSDFYGEKLAEEYIGLMNARAGFRDILDRRKFDVALVPASWPLAAVLRNEPGWRLADSDGKALLFERSAAAQTLAERTGVQ